MARYTGPKTKISRIFGEPITGNGKWLTKNSNPPGMHGATRKRKTLGEYALQLREKQKAKYTYGLLEKQFRKTFDEAARRKGVTGENLIKLLEARLDNTIFRMGVAPSRQAARQPCGFIDEFSDVVPEPFVVLNQPDVNRVVRRIGGLFRHKHNVSEPVYSRNHAFAGIKNFCRS